MLNLTLLQSRFNENAEENFFKVINFIFQAKEKNAQVILIPELFLGSYFCKNQDSKYFNLAYEANDHPYLKRMQDICKKLNIVVPFSFFEKSGPNYFNSVAMINADGSILGIYRKSHIPDGVGYQEKFYFRPGNTGFKVFKTKYGSIGVGICWDQWFFEAARIMTLMGADILLYPTAIGSEPDNPMLNTRTSWQRVMQGHAVGNMIPIAAANRIGDEKGQIFYGHSFLCDEFGDMILEMNKEEDGIKVVPVDIERAKKNRASFGFFRDRRVDLYDEILQ